MSSYVREKVLRIPLEKVDLSYIEGIIKAKFADYYGNDFHFYVERAMPELFDYATVGKFQIAPTCEPFIDYVLDYEYDADGEYGKTRALSENEARKYFPVFKQIDPNIDMSWVRLVEYCWYNCCEAPDYYDHMNDSFYDEI